MELFPLLYAFICPLGYGIANINSSNNELSLKWTKFKGSVKEQAEEYYRITSTADYSEFKSILPPDTKVYIGQRSIWEKIHSDDSGNNNIEYIKVSYELQKNIYAQITSDDRTNLDILTKTLSGLQVQKKDTRDVFISQAINAVDDLTQQINLVHNRLVEWYGAHWPELAEYITDIPQYFRLIITIGDRSSVWPELQLSERKITVITQMAEASLGAEISLEDLTPIQELAQLGLQLVKSKSELEEYIENAALLIMPNVTRLVGPLISARLLSHAGSLKTLSRFPSSTMQLLGAEKALFRHLKTGERPPKHGIIFQSPRIHQAPYHQRGRRARVLAGKLTIASRLDYFLGEDQGSALEDLVDKRIKYIADKFVKPPKRRKSKYPDNKDKRSKRDSGRKSQRGDRRGQRSSGGRGQERRDRGEQQRDRRGQRSSGGRGQEGRDRGGQRRDRGKKQ